MRPLLGADGFSTDLAEGIYTGYTITYFAIQLAVYMGFKEIFLLGLDLAHREGKTHFFGIDFHSQNHENSEFIKMERKMCEAAKILKDMGISIYNCSPITKSKAFPFMDFDAAIAL